MSSVNYICYRWVTSPLQANATAVRCKAFTINIFKPLLTNGLLQSFPPLSILRQ